MAEMRKLFDALHAGRVARRSRMVPNPYRVDSDEHKAFEAGYANDLDAWMRLFKKRSTKRPEPKAGRFRGMEKLVFNSHTSRPRKVWFLGYDHAPKGSCRIMYCDSGEKQVVPTISLTRAEEVPA